MSMTKMTAMMHVYASHRDI